MSVSPSSPASPETPVGSSLSSSPTNRTRTVAIIKTHALEYRFDIELRISEAGFEVVKERQMEFDTETDPDTLYEFFGDDYHSFAEGPVWVYVLERRRAVEVWNTLMGDPDPEVAREETTNSLRALYGLSREQNAVMGSANTEMAEIQIESIFASSPPFPNAELPDVEGHYRHSDHSYAASQATDTTGRLANGKAVFRARPLPATHIKPDIVPRMSKAAALRAGFVVEESKHAPPTPERIAETFANVPGHKRRVTIPVASTAPPTVAPRMSRAASLRLGQKVPEKPRRPSTGGGTSPEVTFDGVPGHKRRESISVASTKPPALAPKTNRSASLRVQKETGPPTSYMFRSPSKEQTPPRSASRASLSGPSSDARTTTTITTTRSASSLSVRSPTATRSTAPRQSTSNAPPSAFGMRGSLEEPKNERDQPPRPPSTQPPAIAPRTNKSALLRAAKMATIAAAKAATNTGGKKALTPKTVKV